MKMLRISEVQERTGLTRSTIYEMMDRGEFPRQVKIAPRIVAWVESEISQWIESRAASREAA